MEVSAVGDERAQVRLERAKITPGQASGPKTFQMKNEFWESFRSAIRDLHFPDRFHSEPALCYFDFMDRGFEETIRRNSNYWVRHLKDRMYEVGCVRGGFGLGRLLSDAPTRPARDHGFGRRARPPPELTCDRFDLLGLATKYNWEYRRPYLNDKNERST